MKNLKDLKENEGVLIKSSSEYERITGSKIDILSSIVLKSDGETCNIDSIDTPITLYSSKVITDYFKPYIVRCVIGNSIVTKGQLYVCLEDYGYYMMIQVGNSKFTIVSHQFERI